MNFLFHIIKISVLAYLAFLGIMYFFQRKLIYFPSKARPSIESFSETYKEIQTQTKDNLTLTHWLARKGYPYIVIFHGNAGNIEDRTNKFRFLISKGYSVLLASYRGYGNNPGQPTEQDFISDSALILEWLFKQEKISSKEVILLGESLGSGVAVALATQYPVKGLILDGAFSSVTDVGQAAYPFVPVRRLLKDTWDSEFRIQQVQAPILFIHSEHDAIVPIRFAQKLFQAANQPKKHIWLEHPGHDNNLETEAVRKQLFYFLQSL